jgi:hypothetical protein
MFHDSDEVETEMMSVLLVMMGLAQAAPPVTRPVEQGVIDWSRMRLEVTISSYHARGAWQDRRLQEQDALDQLSEQISALAVTVSVTADTTVADLLAAGGDLGTRLASGMERWSVEEARYYNQGGVELVGVLDLRAWLWPVLVQLAEAETLPPSEGATGLLVDARGLDVTLSLSPSLRTAGGRLLVSPAGYSPEMARRNAPVLYVADPADPAAVERAGDGPLMVRAEAVDEHGILVLSADSGDRLAREADLPALVSRGNVVIVVGE